MLDLRERRARRAAGEAVREGREVLRRRWRDYQDHERLREVAAEGAGICGECFAPLRATDSVTLVRVVHGRRWLFVPVCLPCWLSDGSQNWDPDSLSYEAVERFRCDGCARPMRVSSRRYRRIAYRWHCCCGQCFRKVTLRRASERRRVCHEKKACVVCGGIFVPRKSNARTCGVRCRQQLHRDRHLPVVVTEAELGALRKGQRFIGRDGKTHRR
jgi:hypothetical protein